MRISDWSSDVCSSDLDAIDAVRRDAPSFRFRYRLGDVVRARRLVEPRQRVENPGAHRGPLLARAFERRLRGLRQRGAVMLMMIVPRHERNLGCRGVRGKSDGSGPAPLLKSPFCDFSNGLSDQRAPIEIVPKRKHPDADDRPDRRPAEQPSELQSLMRTSYADSSLK